VLSTVAQFREEIKANTFFISQHLIFSLSTLYNSTSNKNDAITAYKLLPEAAHNGWVRNSKHL